MRACLGIALTVLALASFAGPGRADDAPAIPVLEMAKADGISFGTVGKVSQACKNDGPAYAVEDLSIFQPVKVTLVAANPRHAVHLHITKPAGTDIIFDGDTNRKGIVIAKFRTQGDMRIVVTSDDPACHFSLLVWAGGTLPPKPRSVLVPIP